MAQGTYEATYTAMGMTSRLATIHIAGSPQPVPRRSQPVGAGDAGSGTESPETSPGAPGASSGAAARPASGPKPYRPPSQNAPAAATPRPTPPAPASSSAWLPRRPPSRARKAPTTIGPAVANQNSSRNQDTGW